MTVDLPTIGEAGPAWALKVRSALAELDGRYIDPATADAVQQAAADAEAAQSAAEAAAASVNPGVAGGVATLDGTAHLTDAEVPPRLSDTALSETFAAGGPAGTGVAATDTANLQDALAVSPNGRVRLPGGLYVINATLTVPAGANVDFGGATIRRATGAGVFDMIKAANVSNVRLANLTVDGNKDADALVSTTVAHRFSGVALVSVTDARLENVTVVGTVNGENQGDDPALRPAAGVWFDQCTRVECVGLHGWSNDRTAIFVNRSSKITIDGSYTHDNQGSGISSATSPDCRYTNIVTFANGYSNLSVNGLRSSVSNVLSWGSLFSGVNIGHQGYASDDTVATNIQSYGNTYDGLTVAGSSRVVVSNFTLWNNQRHGLRVMDSGDNHQFSNGRVSGTVTGQGVYLEVGSGHNLTNVRAHNNNVHGFYVNAPNCGLHGCMAFNNGLTTAGVSGFLVNQTALNTRMIGCRAYDDQATKTQDAGVWLAGGTGHQLVGNHIEGNKTYQTRVTSSPTYVQIDGTPSTGAAKITATSLSLAAGQIGFYGAASVAKPTVAGSRGGNAALASLLTALASQGLITDSSVA